MIFRGVWQFLSNSAFLLLQTTIKFVRINLKIYICRSEPQCDHHIVALFFILQKER